MHNSVSGSKPLLLVFPHNVMAHYLRCIQIAEQLKLYFDIMFLYSCRFHSFVMHAGYETFNCETLDAEKVQQGIISFDFSWLNEKDLNLIYNKQVEVINELRASAVLGDMSPTLRMATEKTGVRYFSLINGYMSQYYAYVRRIPRSFPLYKLCNDLPTSFSNYLISKGEQLSFHKIHGPFKKIRKYARLSAKKSYLQELEGDVNMLCDLPEIFPQKKLPSNYYFVPPLYYKLKSTYNDIIEKIDNNKKTLYVSMGSTGNWEKVIFLNNPDYHHYNIITAGDTNKIIHGPSVFSYPFIDSSKIFEVTDLVICHGGNGTTCQALSFGIPVLCKTTHCEQEYNVDGLERQQLGKSLDDINNDSEYLTIIEEWVQKKGNRQLSFIQNKIAEANNSFQQTIHNMLTTNSVIRFPIPALSV